MDRLENHLALVSHQILKEDVQESQIYVLEETIFLLNVGLHVRQAPEMFENKSHTFVLHFLYNGSFLFHLLSPIFLQTKCHFYRPI